MPSLIKVRDVSLRDGQQLIAGGRLNDEHLRRLLPLYREAHFSMIEIWGGAVPALMMKDLGESPWDRLRICAGELGDISLISGVCRGKYLFEKSPHPPYVLEAFYKEAFANGMQVMRLYDPLNNVDNIRESVLLIKQFGGAADGGLCYAIDAEDDEQLPQPKKGFFARLFDTERRPQKTQLVFTDEYFIEKAKELEAIGVDMITLEDLGGLASPDRIYSLMPKLKHAVRTPIGLHTRCAAGFGLASTLMAILKGVDLIDANVWWFAGGAAAPPLELIWLFCRRLEIELDVDLDAVRKLRKEMESIRMDFAIADDSVSDLPRDFDEALQMMPKGIESQFQIAIDAATERNIPLLLEACSLIEGYFRLPEPTLLPQFPDLPGGLLEEVRSELADVEDAPEFDYVLELAEKVRKDVGMPPLAEPIGTTIADQAVALALDIRDGRPEYSTITPEFQALASGEYGPTPLPVDSSIKIMIEETADDSSDNQETPITETPELSGVKLAQTNEEFLLLELNPELAEAYLRQIRSDNIDPDSKPADTDPDIDTKTPDE